MKAKGKITSTNDKVFNKLLTETVGLAVVGEAVGEVVGLDDTGGRDCRLEVGSLVGLCKKLIRGTKH